MASIPQAALPLFYNELVPLSSQLHGDWKMRQVQGAPFLATTHAVPLLVEEFMQAQRHYPIVFSVGPDPVPLALMGLNEGVNVFVGEDGLFPPDFYVPAYIRRYPFMLARLRPEADELSLCVDPTSPVIGPHEEGDAVFTDGQPSEQTRQILGFCEQFENGSQVTAAFLRELTDNKLLEPGEFSVETQAGQPPHLYSGFQMISEDAVKNLRGDVARKLIQSGAMPLIYAQLFSLQRMGEVFARQGQQGKLPPPNTQRNA